MNRKAIILVAGMGTRLKPLTLENHKCLTEVNGVPIIQNALTQLHAEGVRQTILVVGYLKEQIKGKIGNSFQDMEILYAENDIYDQTNTAYSLKKGLELLSDYDELLLLEGDVFFANDVLHGVLESSSENATVLEPYNEKLDGTFAEIDDAHFVVDWTHKSMRPDNYDVTTKYKTVNIHKFCKEFVNMQLIPEIQVSEAKSGLKNPIENVMMEIVHKNPNLVRGYVLSGEKWFEVDDIQDLEIAERMFA